LPSLPTRTVPRGYIVALGLGRLERELLGLLFVGEARLELRLGDLRLVLRFFEGRVDDLRLVLRFFEVCFF
jgi:hypothetical protein